MLFRAVRINCAANTRAPQTSMPIQSSHTASLIHARKESGGSVSGWRFQGLISGDIHRAISISRPSHLALAGCGGSLFDCNHFVRAIVSPGWSRAVADSDGDYWKGGNLFRPRRAAVAHDDQEVDRIALSLNERANADTDVGPTAAV